MEVTVHTTVHLNSMHSAYNQCMHACFCRVLCVFAAISFWTLFMHVWHAILANEDGFQCSLALFLTQILKNISSEKLCSFKQ